MQMKSQIKLLIAQKKHALSNFGLEKQKNLHFFELHATFCK
jgi:hypothetical protein